MRGRKGEAERRKEKVEVREENRGREGGWEREGGRWRDDGRGVHWEGRVERTIGTRQVICSVFDRIQFSMSFILVPILGWLDMKANVNFFSVRTCCVLIPMHSRDKQCRR